MSLPFLTHTLAFGNQINQRWKRKWFSCLLTLAKENAMLPWDTYLCISDCKLCDEYCNGTKNCRNKYAYWYEGEWSIDSPHDNIGNVETIIYKIQHSSAERQSYIISIVNKADDFEPEWFWLEENGKKEQISFSKFLNLSLNKNYKIRKQKTMFIITKED